MHYSFNVGFYNRKGFIISQHPLDSTVPQFWQLVAEQEVQVVVVLSNLDNEDYKPFWPFATNGQMIWDSGYNQVTLSVLSEDDYVPKTICIRLEVTISTKYSLINPVI